MENTGPPRIVSRETINVEIRSLEEIEQHLSKIKDYVEEPMINDAVALAIRIGSIGHRIDLLLRFVRKLKEKS